MTTKYTGDRQLSPRPSFHATIDQLPPRSTVGLIDIDGTICDSRGVEWVWDALPRPEAYERFHEEIRYCPPLPEGVAHIAHLRVNNTVPVLLSARPTRFQEGTDMWLAEHVPHTYLGPALRDEHGTEDTDWTIAAATAVEFKREVVQELRRRGHIVAMAADDNSGNLAMFREEGIPRVLDARQWWPEVT